MGVSILPLQDRKSFMLTDRRSDDEEPHFIGTGSDRPIYIAYFSVVMLLLSVLQPSMPVSLEVLHFYCRKTTSNKI